MRDSLLTLEMTYQIEIIAGMPPAILLIESISTDVFSSGGSAEDRKLFFSRSNIWENDQMKTVRR
jgi:hypothetical protein